MKKNFNNVLGGAIASLTADESVIREKIIIREDFKALIPPLSDEEFDQLENNILEEGVRDPLIIWRFESSFILADGHNRFFICQKHGLSFPFKEMQFKDEQDVMDWMIKTQLGRRNLSPEKASYLRGLKYNRTKSQGKRTDLTLAQNEPKSSFSTAALLGKEHNVAAATIKRDGEFAKGLDIIGSTDPKLKEEILNGKSELSKQEIIALANNDADDPNSSKPSKVKKVSANELAQIAFTYIKVETRSIDEVCEHMGEESIKLNPTEYFLKWNSLRGRE